VAPKLKRIWILGIVLCALVVPATANAKGGQFTFDGGNTFQRTQVAKALNVSRFDWNLVPPATVHIKKGIDSYALPGNIYLNADLLNAGMFSWGVVQHEYAHLLDFALFDEETRTSLLPRLGAPEWWTGERHESRGVERFASTLAWAYWPVEDNAMKPQYPGDESSAMKPLAFRTMLKKLLVTRGVTGAERLPLTLTVPKTASR
jgi:hypothetical protein